MTRNCLSRKRSVTSNSSSACNDRFSVYFSNPEFLFNNKVYSFCLNTKKEPSILVGGLCRSSLKKGFERQWIK